MPAFNKEEMKKTVLLFDLPLVCECRYPYKVFHDHKHKGNGRMPVWGNGRSAFVAWVASLGFGERNGRALPLTGRGSG